MEHISLQRFNEERNIGRVKWCYYYIVAGTSPIYLRRCRISGIITFSSDIFTIDDISCLDLFDAIIIDNYTNNCLKVVIIHLYLICTNKNDALFADNPRVSE